MSEVEVLARVERRRRWTPAEKAALLAEVEAGGKIRIVARRYGISQSLLYNWRSAKKAALEAGAGSSGPITSYRAYIKVIGTSDYFALWIDDGRVDVSVPLTPASARVLADLLLAISSPECKHTPSAGSGAAAECGSDT
jgi:transposase